MSSVPSSMIVRSALKLVSNTLSKPARRRAVFISKVSGVPGSRPKSSPMAARGAGGAAVHALPAVDADDVAQRQVLEGRDDGVVAAVDRLENADLLEVDAGAHAAPAADALVHVAHHGVAREVGLELRLLGMPEGERADAVLLGQRLQLAVAVAHAAVALAVVLAEQQLEHVAARLAHLARVRADGQRVGDGVHAGGLQRALPLDVDDAHAAHARDLEVGVVAERRDLDADGLGGVEDGHAERHLGLDAVDGDGDESTDGLGIVGDRHCAADLAGRDARGLLLVSGVVGHAGVLAVSAWAGRLMISSPKCSRMDMKALELVWPRPHLEATCMVPLSSRSSATYSAEQAPSFSCSAASSILALPTRHGVH